MYIHTFTFLYDVYHWTEVLSCKSKRERRRNEKFDEPKHDYKVRAAHNIDREPRVKWEILFHVVFAQVVRYLHTQLISEPRRPRRHIRKWFQVCEFERSARIRNCRVGMVYLFGKDYPHIRLVPFSLPSCPRAQADGRAARNNPTRATLGHDRVCGLWESICQRIFPFGYVRIRDGVPTHSSWLIHTPRYFLLYLYRLCLHEEILPTAVLWYE